MLRKNGHKTGILRFARYGEYNTFTYNQSGFKIEGHGCKDLLWLSKIGFIEIRKHRETPSNMKQIVVSRSKSGKWYACVSCEIDAVLPEINTTRSVGIDVGIKNLAYDSDGHATLNPLNLQNMLKSLRKAQRKISRKQPNSNNRKKAVRFYQLIHERIRNKRRDFLHKLSTQYARKYDIIFVEELQKLNMIKNHRLARCILDSGWGMFVSMLDYKCKMLVEVPSKNTTIDCSRCGNPVLKNLDIRFHKCDKCNLSLDRDHNAAINILKNGLGIFEIKLPQELREVTPVEISMMSEKQEKSIATI